MSHTIISSSTIEFSIFKDFNFDKNIHSLSDCSSNYSPLVLKIPIRLLSASLKIITRIIWAQFHLFTNNLLTQGSKLEAASWVPMAPSRREIYDYIEIRGRQNKIFSSKIRLTTLISSPDTIDKLNQYCF